MTNAEKDAGRPRHGHGDGALLVAGDGTPGLPRGLECRPTSRERAKSPCVPTVHAEGGGETARHVSVRAGAGRVVLCCMHTRRREWVAAWNLLYFVFIFAGFVGFYIKY